MKWSHPARADRCGRRSCLRPPELDLLRSFDRPEPIEAVSCSCGESDRFRAAVPELAKAIESGCHALDIGKGAAKIRRKEVCILQRIVA